MTEPVRVLFVDDSAADVGLLVQRLRSRWARLEHERVDALPGLRSALQHRTWDAVICVWTLRTFNAMRALELTREVGGDVPFLIVAPPSMEEAAANATRSGVNDYILTTGLARLVPALERELRGNDVRLEQRRSERALRVQETRFRALVEKGQDGLFMSAADGSLIYISPRGRALLGIDPDAALNAPGLWENEERAWLADLRGALMDRPGESISAEFQVKRTAGSPRWIELTATNLLDEPDVRAVVGNFRDVTERRNGLAELRTSEARFRALYDSGIIGIAISSHVGAFLEANDTLLAMIGYSRADLEAGKVRWADMTPPEFVHATAGITEQLRTRGFANAREKQYFRKDGSRLPCLVGVSALDADSNVALVVDLTERKQIERALHFSEEQLRQAQKMEAVGRLAGSVAHDFNNLLSVILSFTALAQEGIAPEDQAQSDLAEIHRAAERAADLTKQLLLFSRQQVLETKVLDLAAVFAGMKRLVDRLVGEDIRVVAKIAASPWFVRADPGSIEQVIMNLVVNARDAMASGGALTIEIANVQLDEEYARTHHGAQAGPHVMLSVTDTGVGMDAATLEKIFEPFFTTKEVGKGTGLGLSTVFGIVQQSGGTIWVESSPGKGAAFKVYLPRVLEEVDPEDAAPLSSTFRGTETILLVEDEEQLRLVAREILQRYGYSVLEARNGGEAIAVVERHEGRIDLLLSDVVMPAMSGPDLAIRLGLTRPEMRVLCMSGYADDNAGRHGLDGRFAFLQKPFTPASICRKVRETLDATRG